jgi:hypothetical protein
MLIKNKPPPIAHTCSQANFLSSSQPGGNALSKASPNINIATNLSIIHPREIGRDHL